MLVALEFISTKTSDLSQSVQCALCCTEVIGKAFQQQLALLALLAVVEDAESKEYRL